MARAISRNCFGDRPAILGINRWPIRSKPLFFCQSNRSPFTNRPNASCGLLHFSNSAGPLHNIPKQSFEFIHCLIVSCTFVC